MKIKLKIILIIFLIGIAGGTLALESGKLNFDQDISLGETLIGTVEFPENTTILTNNPEITIIQGRKTIPMALDSVTYKNKIYFYIYPSTVGNYQLSINKIAYRLGESRASENLKKNFSVSNSEKDVLSVKPGFIQTAGEAEIKITNKGNSILNITTPESSFQLGPYSSKNLVFNPKYDLSDYTISSYKTFKVPIIYYNGVKNPKPIEENDENNDEESSGIFLHKKLTVNPENISVTLFTGQTFIKKLNITNTGDLTINDIKIISPYNITIENKSLQGFSLSKGEGITGEIKLSSTNSNGTIKVLFGRTEVIIPIEININSTQGNNEKTCKEIGGRYCNNSLNLTCSGEVVPTKDQFLCCKTKCVKIEGEKKGNGKIIVGIILILILTGAGYFFYNRYNNTQEKDFVKALREKNSNRFKEKEFQDKESLSRKKEGLKDEVNNKK